MKITFIVPGSGHDPVGGFKVIYEYANGLVRRGHDVVVVHPARAVRDMPFSERGKRLLYFLMRAMDGAYRPVRWFAIDPRVRLLWTPSLHSRYVPDADIVVSTSWQTAEWVKDYGKSKGKRCYYIHDYEHYMVAGPQLKKRIASTYLLGMYNIVTSPAGSRMLSECGAPIHAYIPNGLDFKIFKLDSDIESDIRTGIGFPARAAPYKGTEDAVQALEIVRSRLGDTFEAWCFGASRLSCVPSWIAFIQKPSDREIAAWHNRSMIFVVPSHYEGWGLPGAEAMACGAALVSTDNGGVRAYAEHEQNALFSPPKDPVRLAENIMRLIQNRDLRITLARQGNQVIQQFTWESAVDALLVHFTKIRL